jgi:hypothetical protein
MNEADFIDFLDAMGVSVFGNMTAEDMLEESKALARLARLMSKLFFPGQGSRRGVCCQRRGLSKPPV